MSKVITIHYGYHNEPHHRATSLSFHLPAEMPDDGVDGELTPEAYAFAIMQRLQRACNQREVVPEDALGAFIPDQVLMPAPYPWSMEKGARNEYDPDQGDHTWCYLADVTVDDADPAETGTHPERWRLETFVERFEAMAGQWRPIEPEKSPGPRARAERALERVAKPLRDDKPRPDRVADALARMNAIADEVAAFDGRRGLRLAGLAEQFAAVAAVADERAQQEDDARPR